MFAMKDTHFRQEIGGPGAVEFVSNVYLVDHHKVIQCNIRNMTQRKQLEEKLRTLSIMDDLTGLYNRRGSLHPSQQQMKVTDRTKKDMLLFFCRSG